MGNKKEQLKEQLINNLATFVEQGQWAKAARAQEGLIDLEPTNSNYYLRLGDYHVKTGNRTSAVQAYYQAAELFVRAGFSVKGIATYKMILRVAPDEVQTMALMRAINSSPAVTGAAFPSPTSQVEGAPPPPASPPLPVERLYSEPVIERELEPSPAPAIELDLDIGLELEIETEAVPAQDKKDINSLFAALSKEEFGAIVDHLEPIGFQDGERMVAEGEKGDAMYLLSSGAGRVIKEVEGQAVLLGILSEGEFFGEMSLLISGPRSASVFAVGPTEVLRLKSADLFEITKTYPRIEAILEEFYEKRSKAILQKMKELRKSW